MRTTQICIWLLHTLVVLLLLFKDAAEAQSIVKTLPGYPGPLPFKLETGYISVGEKDEIQLFYYFIESERNPEDDPLVLWHTGAQDCKSFIGVAYDIGPLKFNVSKGFDGSLPTLYLNPYSWTKTSSIIFIDWPAGIGFSYSNVSASYSSSDSKSAKDIYAFLRKWLLKHPTFIKNRLYIGGDSYGAKMAVLVANEVSKGNEAGLQPLLFLQGFVIGNPFSTTLSSTYSDRVPYAHLMALVSDEYYEAAQKSCDGLYYNPDPNNLECVYALRVIEKCVQDINPAHVLEPKCSSDSASKLDEFRRDRIVMENDAISHLYLPSQEENPCFLQSNVPSDVWANNPSVQEALHIRKGTIKRWGRCDNNYVFDQNVESAIPYLELLSKQEYHALVYSGDHDMIVPHINTLNWIRNLNMTLVDDWRPWNVDGQVAGYTERYKNKYFYITFATVKGGGHSAAHNYPKECLGMIERWFDLYPL